MAKEEDVEVSRERRKRVRKTLEFLNYDGQLLLEPQWYSKPHEEENKHRNNKD